jgi:hypothetical protein
MLKGNKNVFISEYSRAKWGWNEDEADVIHHGVDTDLFNDYEQDRLCRILSVCNDWINRDEPCGFSFWKEACNTLPVFPVGDTPGLSKPAETVEQLVEFYNTSQVFANTSLVSPVPTSLLEAMSCGCCCVSTDTCMIPEIIKDGYNGFLVKTPYEMRKKLEVCLSDPDLCKEIGKNARKTILERFSLQQFIDNWNSLFEEASHFVYRGDYEN